MSVRVSAKTSAQVYGRALTAVSVVVCASFALSGCGQRGALYMPGSKPPQSKHSHFIFGSDTTTSTTPAPVAKPKAPASPSGVARPYVPGPVMGQLRDDPTSDNGSNTDTVTVGPAVGSTS